jgi:twitching motility two-component system response regulator PilH
MMKNRQKILVIDDDPKALILMEAVLKPYGYDVVLINDGREVIQTAKKEKPDLILLDIMMPGMDGYTILNKIKKEEAIKNIPVVMVTALELDGNKVFASICGASAYATKPINSQHLIETITQFLPNFRH